MLDVGLKWVRLAPNGTNLRLFKISFSTFWRSAPKCIETDLIKSQICTIWCQSDPLWLSNLTSLFLMSIHRLLPTTNQLSGVFILVNSVHDLIAWCGTGRTWLSDWPYIIPDWANLSLFYDQVASYRPKCTVNWALNWTRLAPIRKFRDCFRPILDILHR